MLGYRVKLLWALQNLWCAVVWFQSPGRAYILYTISLICLHVDFKKNKRLVGFVFWETHLGKCCPSMFLLVCAHCQGFLLSGAPLVSGGQMERDGWGLPWTMMLREGWLWVREFAFLGTCEAPGQTTPFHSAWLGLAVQGCDLLVSENSVVLRCLWDKGNQLGMPEQFANHFWLCFNDAKKAMGIYSTKVPTNWSFYTYVHIQLYMYAHTHTHTHTQCRRKFTAASVTKQSSMFSNSILLLKTWSKQGLCVCVCVHFLGWGFIVFIKFSAVSVS